mmetsp:Transcript_36006/g.112173  ORF Transcript_36006/g.112173 Transcript_36006/m.112173 type:complete len:257 (-) Transcript_36006:84-854(-)
MEEDLVANARARGDACEVPPAKEELVRVPGEPKEVRLLQRQAPAAGLVAQRRDDACQEREERRDAHPRTDGDEDVARQGRRHWSSVGPIEGHHRRGLQPLAQIQTALRQGVRPVAHALDDEVHGVVLSAGTDREGMPLPARYLGDVQVGVHALLEAPQEGGLADLQGCHCIARPAIYSGSYDHGHDANAAFKEVEANHAEDPVDEVEARGDCTDGDHERDANAKPVLCAVDEEEDIPQPHAPIMDVPKVLVLAPAP